VSINTNFPIFTILDLSLSTWGSSITMIQRKKCTCQSKACARQQVWNRKPSLKH